MLSEKVQGVIAQHELELKLEAEWSGQARDLNEEDSFRARVRERWEVWTVDDPLLCLIYLRNINTAPADFLHELVRSIRVVRGVIESTSLIVENSELEGEERVKYPLLRR